MALEELGILLGNKCNFKCAHCLGTLTSDNIKKAEIVFWAKIINKYGTQKLIFVGGEPTLYIKEINQLLSKLTKLDIKDIKITTNGSFAKNLIITKRILNSFFRLNSVQLSYDKFHKKFLPLKNVKNLYLTCKKLKIDFSIILTISSPQDLTLIKDLKKIGKLMIGVQKVFPIGSAIANSVYYTVPSFDSNLVHKKCPNIGKIKYYPSYGFSVCTSYLMYNSNLSIRKRVSHQDLVTYFKTDFYRLISKYRFSEIIKRLKLNVNFSGKNFIAECDICKEIFYRYYGFKI